MRLAKREIDVEDTAEPTLHENAGLVPVDVLVGDLPVLAPHDHHEGNLNGLVSRLHVGEKSVNDGRVGEGDDHFVYYLRFGDRFADWGELNIRREEFSCFSI